ncbi:ABC transporter permease [Candidatus Methylacidithermus pantelleriae]|uniref:Lipoprotein releasing system transmembrane protein LolC n=1 Tax=Candidatus Methylacidithermus pantelleriae TaxID=2744239 RepID=A0A8J2FRY7_9BACT|nr:ABC transporter permease [Candidatus Methylacidithermus pantelleriae]CAF0691995.1 Lipoprotein releasing system transmembrane protein LolC [Candidatus Methylacidithermus pantelleriae]
MLPWFLALRYLRPRRSFVSAITLITLAGVALGVMVLVVVLSVMAGFQKELEAKVMGFQSHLMIVSDGIVEHPEEIVRKLSQDPQVQSASPFVMGPVLAEFDSRITTPVLRGMDARRQDWAAPLQRFLVQGDANLEGEALLVGDEWARRNGARVGSRVRIYAPRQLENLRSQGKSSPQRSVVLPTELQIVGIFHTGLFDYDAGFFVTSLENAQYLYNLGSGVHGIAVRIQEVMQASELQRRWQKELGPELRVMTWMDQNRPLFTAVTVERVVMAFILSFIVVVAGFGLCNTLITVTVQKTREIGLLKALGATDEQVMGIFILYGAVVGVIGSLAGLVLAILVLQLRNSFRDFLARRLGIDLFAPDVYHLAEIPVDIHWGLVAGVVAAALSICVLAAWIPALQAARLPPSRALRYE